MPNSLYEAKHEKLIDEYFSSEAYKALAELRKVENVFIIFNQNFAELDKVLSITKKIATADKQSIQDIMDNFGKLFNKGPMLIFNFLSSTKALIDITRKFIKTNYRNTTFEKLYSCHIKTTFDNQTCKFIQHFRNYHTHQDCPKYAISITPIGAKGNKRFKYSLEAPEPDLTQDVMLYREFINYYKIVCKFYKWFFNEWRKYHKQDIALSKKIAKKIEKIYPNDDKSKQMVRTIYMQPFHDMFKQTLH